MRQLRVAERHMRRELRQSSRRTEGADPALPKLRPPAQIGSTESGRSFQLPGAQRAADVHLGNVEHLMREAIRMNSEAISMPPSCASAEGGHPRQSSIISGNQASSVAIKRHHEGGHPRQSSVISGHQASSVAINLEYLVRLELSLVACRDRQCSLDLAALEQPSDPVVPIARTGHDDVPR